MLTRKAHVETFQWRGNNLFCEKCVDYIAMCVCQIYWIVHLRLGIWDVSNLSVLLIKPLKYFNIPKKCIYVLIDYTLRHEIAWCISLLGLP